MKGWVCVTGGTGYLGSWMVKRLLEDGYSVKTTVRNTDPEHKRDISYLLNLPGASEKLQIFNASLEQPDSYTAAIIGCVGLFHVAHPLDFEEKESEETKSKRAIDAIHAMLQACIDAKTVKRVVLTSSISATALAGTTELIDESSWTDVELVRRSNMFLGPYIVTKTLSEKAAFEFAEKHGIDLVSVLPTWISGPFICPNVPVTVRITLGLVLGQENLYQLLNRTSIVHVDDVARAHIHVFENHIAKGRYLCTGVETSLKDLYTFFSNQYPEYQMPAEIVEKESPLVLSGIPSTKLLASGFKFENGLQEIFHGAITCCREKSVL